MTIKKIISKKQRGKKLSKKEIDFFVQGYTSGEISDADMTFLLTAIRDCGMNFRETYNLTISMFNSGETLDLSRLGSCADKHSSGGVGDSTTLLLAPILASVGVKIVKLSGGSLGRTGGTIDKFKVLGVRTDLNANEAKEIAGKVGAVILQQTEELDPADKKIYSLRSKTNTVASIPLIASSIISKKLASGAKTIVLDVKFGEGAIISKLNEAKELAHIMIKILKKQKIACKAIISDMNQPLGYAVGDEVEMREVISLLKSGADTRLLRLAKYIAGLIYQMQTGASLGASLKIVSGAVERKSAFNKLREMTLAQGGSLDLFDLPPIRGDIFCSEQEGFIKSIDAKLLETCVQEMKKQDASSKGILTYVKVGNEVKNGMKMFEIFAPKKTYEKYLEQIKKCFIITDEKTDELPLIYDILD